MALTFLWTCQSTTFDGTDDYSAGDSTPTAVSSPVLSAAKSHPPGGRSIKSDPDGYYEFDSASIYIETDGACAFNFNIPDWNTAEVLKFVNSAAANDHLIVSLSGTGVADGGISVNLRQAGIAQITVATGDIGLSIDTLYSIILRYSSTNEDLRVEVYDDNEVLIGSAENLATGSGPWPGTINRMLVGDTAGSDSFTSYVGHIMVANSYSEPLEDNLRIPTYADYEVADDQIYTLSSVTEIHTRKPNYLTEIDWTHPIVRKGLIHAFVVNENGGVPQDLVQGINDWATVDRPLWAVDEDGMHLDFVTAGDPGVDCVDVPVTQQLSIFAIAKRTTSMQYEHIIGRHPGWFFSGNAGQLRLGIDTGTNVNAHCEDTDPGTDNIAYAYGATYDGATVDAYKEGVLNESNVQTGDIDLSGSTQFGGYWGGGFSWNGNLYVTYVFKDVLTPHDHASLAANPWQLLKPKDTWISFVEAATTATNLIIQSATHGHTVDTVALTQLHSLLVQDVLHGHTADNVTLGAGADLLIQDGLHGHLADILGLTQYHQLLINEALHNHIADNVDLTQDHQLAVDEALHAHTADNVSLTQLHILTIDEALHGHTADNVVLSTAGLLAIANTLHAHLGDNVALTQDHQLLIDEALHSHTADSPALTQDHQLSIDEALHSHTADNVTLTEETILQVADALHAHTADSISLTQNQQLVIADAIHSHTGETIALTQDHILIVSDSLHVLVSDLVTLSTFIPADVPSSRVYAIELESRIYLVARKSSDRVYSIPKV